MARCPTDFKSPNSIEHLITTKGLPEDRHIGPDEKTSKNTLTSWVNTIHIYMEERGLDSVFRVYDGEADTETYLLTDWGSANPEHSSGVPHPDDGDNTKDTQQVCDYDHDNLKWSGKAILNSVSLELWETAEKDLGADTVGLEVSAAVVYKLQQVS
jgi:hypothetical protein